MLQLLIFQGYRTCARLLTQGFGAGPVFTTLLLTTQSASGDGATTSAAGDSATAQGGTL